jgi:hypothetical protein
MDVLGNEIGVLRKVQRAVWVVQNYIDWGAPSGGLYFKWKQ